MENNLFAVIYELKILYHPFTKNIETVYASSFDMAIQYVIEDKKKNYHYLPDDAVKIKILAVINLGESENVY